MVTKRVSVGKKAKRRKTTTAAPKITESSVIALLESRRTATAVSTSLDPDVRRQLMARRRISSPSGADLRRVMNSRIG